MTPYEQLFTLMKKKEKKKETIIYEGIMTSEKTCTIGEIELEEEDIVIAEHLTTGYFKNINEKQPSKKEETTFVYPLKAGDVVLVVKINEEKYAIVERFE